MLQILLWIIINIQRVIEKSIMNIYVSDAQMLRFYSICLGFYWSHKTDITDRVWEAFLVLPFPPSPEITIILDLGLLLFQCMYNLMWNSVLSFIKQFYLFHLTFTALEVCGELHRVFISLLKSIAHQIIPLSLSKSYPVWSTVYDL